MKVSKLFPQSFTVLSANRMLPLVESITADIVQITNEVDQTRSRLDYLNDGRVAERMDDIYSREVFAIEKHLDERSASVERYSKELTELDLMPGSISEGYVDFPAMRGDAPICLCWKLGESELKFWHGFEETCSNRRPLDLVLLRQAGDHALV